MRVEVDSEGRVFDFGNFPIVYPVPDGVTYVHIVFSDPTAVTEFAVDLEIVGIYRGNVLTVRAYIPEWQEPYLVTFPSIGQWTYTMYPGDGDFPISTGIMDVVIPHSLPDDNVYNADNVVKTYEPTLEQQ